LIKSLEKHDSFSKRIQTYSDTVGELDFKISRKLIAESVKECFNEESVDILPSLVVKPFGVAELNLNIVDGLKSGQTLLKYVDLMAKTYNVEMPKNTPPTITISFMRKSAPNRFESNNLEQINNFWTICQQKLNARPERKFIIEENDKLLEDAKNINKELTKRIEEPWRI
jgi:hypothetical protein